MDARRIYSNEADAQKKRKNGRIPEWPNGADCKSAGLHLRWFESIFSHKESPRGSFLVKQV